MTNHELAFKIGSMWADGQFLKGEGLVDYLNGMPKGDKESMIEDIRILEEPKTQEEMFEELAYYKAKYQRTANLRQGDFELVRILAKDAGIPIKASDHCPGTQWEEFHAGVMEMRRKLDKNKSLPGLDTAVKV